MRVPVLVFLASLLFAGQVLAFSADEPLPDPVQEQRAREISGNLRCLVCQNQSILDSEAPLARDLRVLVRERIAGGDSDDQVVGYVVDRYGDWVLLNPPFKAYTYLLWFGPLILFVLAVFGVVIYFRKSNRTVVPSAAALSIDEQNRLKRLLDDSGQKEIS